MSGKDALKTTVKVVQLYDLKDAPGDKKNPEDMHPDGVDELANDLAKTLHDGRSTPGKWQTNEDWPYLDETTMVKYPQL